MEHYRCFTVWAIKSRQARVVNQLMWFPKTHFPRLNNIDLLRATIEDAKVLLCNPPTETFVSTMEATNREQLVHFFNTIKCHTHTHTAEKPSIIDTEIPAPTLGVPTDTRRQSTRINPGISENSFVLRA